MKISVEHKDRLHFFLKELKNIYQERYQIYDPYETKITSINKKDIIYIYSETVNKTLYDLNEKRKQMFRINQYTGDISDNRLYHEQKIIGNIMDQDYGLKELRNEHEVLVFEFNKLGDIKTIPEGIISAIIQITRTGENDFNKIIVDGPLMLWVHGYIDNKNIFTHRGKHLINILIAMGYDYRYINTKLQVNEWINEL